MKKLLRVAFCFLLCIFALVGCAKPPALHASPTVNGDSVAELSIYAFDAKSEKVFGLMNLGHGFISVKNVSDGALTIGGFTLEKNHEVSIGAWGQSAHWGIWYNLESAYMSLGRYDGIASITQGLNLQKLALVNSFLLANDNWTPIKNCSYFALEAWNVAAEKQDVIDLGAFITPTKLANRLTQTHTYKTNRKIINFDKIGYAVGGDPAKFNVFTMREVNN